MSEFQGTQVISISSTSAIQAALRRSRKAPRPGDSHEAEMSYRAPNGRLFAVREFAENDFFLEEFRPNGRIVIESDGSPAHFRDDGRVSALIADPNGFAAAFLASGIEGEVIRLGEGLGVASRYYVDLEAVAAEIAGALGRNRWYQATDVARLADPAFQETLRQTEVAMRASWKERQSVLRDEALREGHGIFKGLHNMRGTLDESARKAILSFCNAPTDERWEAIAHMVVHGGTTLWQAWADVDPLCPRSKDKGRWPSIPSAETLIGAIRHVTGLPETQPDESAPCNVAAFPSR